MPLTEKQKEYKKQYRLKNKEKLKEQRKKWDSKYETKNKQAINNRIKAYKHKHPEKVQKINFMRRYKMLVDCDLEVLYKNYCAETHCDLCCMPFSKERGKYLKCLDHDHETNKFRNFLCVSCNFKTDRKFKDDKEKIKISPIKQERLKEQRKKYREKNKERLKEQRKEWDKEYRNKNKEKIKEQRKEWNKKYREKQKNLKKIKIKDTKL